MWSVTFNPLRYLYLFPRPNVIFYTYLNKACMASQVSLCCSLLVSRPSTPNVVSLLVQRQRRWASNKTALGKCPVFTGLGWILCRCNLSDESRYLSSQKKTCCCFSFNLSKNSCVLLHMYWRIKTAPRTKRIKIFIMAINFRTLRFNGC